MLRLQEAFRRSLCLSLSLSHTLFLHLFSLPLAFFPFLYRVSAVFDFWWMAFASPSRKRNRTQALWTLIIGECETNYGMRKVAGTNHTAIEA